MGDEKKNSENKGPEKPETDLKQINFLGRVLGHTGEKKQFNYTRTISNAVVYLKIHTVENKKETVYSTIDEKDMNKLAQTHPEILFLLTNYSDSLAPRLVNEEGYFKFEKVPFNWWCYIICARIDDADYSITDAFGNNGFGNNQEIKGEDLQKFKGETLDSIIIPVTDKWYVIPKPKKDDPETDPNTVPSGIPTKS